LHPNEPMQLQLTFRKVEKKDDSRCFVEEVSGVLPLLAMPDAQPPELIRSLGDPEQSRTCPETTRETRS